MKIKFANGVVKECSPPTEQKVFKNANGDAGWVLHLRLIGGMTSEELDTLITPENITTLEFSVMTDTEEEKLAFTLDGYNKITSSTIRHAEDTASTTAEIQLTKGME